MILAADAKQLFVSVLSAALGTSSAQANRKYVRATVPGGIVTVTVPLEVALGPNAGTARAPVRSTSPALRSLSRDR